MTTQRLTIERPGAFRRRRFVVPHRRRSRTAMLLKPFLSAVLLVGLPVAAAMWVYTSPRFLLREVQIGRTDRVATEEITASLASLEGRHLVGLSLAEVEERLTVNPWIASAAIRKELPDRLVIEIEEREPVLMLRTDEGLMYLDATGFVIGPYDLGGPVDLIQVRAEAGAELDIHQVLELAAALQRLAPTVFSGLSEIEVLGLGDFRIHTSDLEFPVLISIEELQSQIAKLERLLPEISRRFESVESVDLRFSRQIVIQPAGEPRSQEG